MMLSHYLQMFWHKETINYIIEQFYVHKNLTPICSKLIFRRLLIKLATECTFKLNSRFLKQVDGCTMGGPLSVTFSDIFMVKMENDIVIPSKPIFYRRIVDDIYSRWKLGDNVLFDLLNSYHSNIQLTIEVNPNSFLDTKLTTIICTYKVNVCRKSTKLPSPLSSKTHMKYNQWWFSSLTKNIIKLWRKNRSDKRKFYEGWLLIAFH